MFAPCIAINRQLAEQVQETIAANNITELSVVLGDEPRVRLFKGDRAPDKQQLEQWTAMSADLCKELACDSAEFAACLIVKTNAHPQKRHMQPEPAETCAFCNGYMAEEAHAGCCQRCEFGGTDQRVAMAVLHDLDATNWQPQLRGHTLALKAGQVLMFDSSRRPHDVPPKKAASARISIEVHTCSNKLQGVPSSPAVLGLLGQAHEHLVKHKTLHVREAFNSQWLFDLFANHGLPPVADSVRTRGARKDFVPVNAVNCPSTTAAVFSLWLQTSQPRALLKQKIDSFSPREFKLTSTTKRATERIRNEAVYATHLVFMVTDWLLWPWWFSGDKLLDYIEKAHAVLLPHREREVELYLELAGCLAVLKSDHSLFAKTRKFIDTLDWDKAFAYEVGVTRKKRFADDVKLHMLFLRAWFTALADQWQQLKLCTSK